MKEDFFPSGSWKWVFMHNNVDYDSIFKLIASIIESICCNKHNNEIIQKHDKLRSESIYEYF